MRATDSTAGTPARQMGQHLRHVREDAGLTPEAVAAKLRTPKGLILALEEGDWAHLDAPVFVRGHLRSYAHLLGIELAGLDEIIADVPAPITPMVRTGRGSQVFGWLGARMVYAVITVLVGVPIWIAAQRHLATPEAVQEVALDIPEIQSASPPDRPFLAANDAPTSAPMPATPPPAPTATPAPPMTAIASLLPPRTPEPSQAEIILHMDQDSWVELYAPDGLSLEQKLLRAGEVRRFAHGQLGRVVIGNAEGVTLRIGGEVQDLSSVRRANVARFAVSSAGSIRPLAD